MINRLIDKRYSPRAFSSRQVEKEKILEIFTAGSYAASAHNEQPWRFIYATEEKPEEYSFLFECLVEWNQKWVGKAPVLIVAIAKKEFTKNLQPNYHALYDLGQAVANMAIQAIGLDLYMHQIGGFSAEKAKKNLNIPDGYEAISMIALGYLGKKENLEEEFRKIENNTRVRNPVNEFVYKGKWK